MGGKWRQTTLGEIAAPTKSAFVDGPFGSALPASEYTSVGIPVIRGGNLSLGLERFFDGGYVYISESTAERLSRALCVPGDIVFTKKGTIGQTGIIPEHGLHRRFLISSNQMKLTVDSEKAVPLFVYYAVSSPASRAKIIQDASVTGVPKINLTYLRQFPIDLPSLSEQRAIAHILGTIDDKIELNRRMNETLEAMARALFKSWFVDFDPVRAKAQGQTPAGMDPATAALFPSEFQDSELGEIPKGWSPATASSIAKLTSGKRPNSRFKERTPASPVPLYGGGGVMAYVPEPLYSTAILLTGRVGTLGLLFRVTEPCWPSDNTLVLLPTCGFDFDFLRYHLARVDFASLNRGSTQPLLTQRDLGSQQFVLPPPALRKAFTDVSAPLFARQTANGNETATLRRLRDTLLPRLLSGELSVANAERVVEATA